MSFGGPTGADEVEPFLLELFDDPDVIHFPLGRTLQRRFARAVAPRRARKVIAQYDHIGGSPLVATTRAQADALSARLGDRVCGTFVGMRYTAPTMAQMVAEIAETPPDRIVALAMYPHYSGTTTGSSFNLFARLMGEAGLSRLPVHYIPAFFEHPLYVRAMVGRIDEAKAPVEDLGSAHLLFSAHGLPSSYARAGDPYPDHVRASVRRIVDALAWSSTYSLSFQSRVGPVRWLGPSTEQELRRLASAGVREALIVPLSFVTEGIETLYEIDVTFRETAEQLNLRVHRVRTLDDHPDFIDCLADTVERGVADESHDGLGQHRCVRCLLPKPHAHRMRVICPDCRFVTPEFLLRLPPVAEEGP